MTLFPTAENPIPSENLDGQRTFRPWIADAEELIELIGGIKLDSEEGFASYREWLRQRGFDLIWYANGSGINVVFPRNEISRDLAIGNLYKNHKAALRNMQDCIVCVLKEQIADFEEKFSKAAKPDSRHNSLDKS